MKRLDSRTAAGLVALLALGGALLPQKPQDDELARDIQAAVEELHGLRARRLELQGKATSDGESLGLAIADLETRVAEARLLLDEEGRRAEELGREHGKLSAAGAAGEAYLNATATAAARLLAGWRPFVDAGPTFARAERLARLDALAADLAHGGRTRAEGLVELGAFLADELHLGATLDARSERIELEGGALRPHASVLRMGHLLEIMASEDGKLLGLLLGGDWITDLPEDVRGKVERLLAATRTRGVPALQRVPLCGRMVEGRAR